MSVVSAKSIGFTKPGDTIQRQEFDVTDLTRPPTAGGRAYAPSREPTRRRPPHPQSLPPLPGGGFIPHPQLDSTQRSAPWGGPGIPPPGAANPQPALVIPAEKGSSRRGSDVGGRSSVSLGRLSRASGGSTPKIGDMSRITALEQMLRFEKDVRTETEGVVQSLRGRQAKLLKQLSPQQIHDLKLEMEGAREQWGKEVDRKRRELLDQAAVRAEAASAGIGGDDCSRDVGDAGSWVAADQQQTAEDCVGSCVNGGAESAVGSCAKAPMSEIAVASVEGDGIPNRFCPGAIGQYETHRRYSLLDPKSWRQYVRPKPPCVAPHGPPHPYIQYPDIPATVDSTGRRLPGTIDDAAEDSAQLGSTRWRSTRTRLHVDHRNVPVIHG